MENKILVFILTHGRAGNISTIKALEKSGYTGEIVYLIDDEDKTRDEYLKRYKNRVEIFDKKIYADLADEMDNFDDRRSIVHARHASYDIAKKRGYRYFIMLDDDYTGFAFKFNQDLEYRDKPIKNLDLVFQKMVNFLNESGAMTVCFAQGGDFLGGGDGSFGKKIKLRRKAMNSFFCDTEKRIWFYGRLNDDVNTYARRGNLGELFFTFGMVALNQKATQSVNGGMTEVYKAGGTYVKSFYTVMLCPSFVKIAMMGETHRRLHHKITWKNAVPMILHPKHKKDV
jgi:hypothetical protein